MAGVSGFDPFRVFGEVPMRTIALRFPDDTAQRLKQLAASRRISLNKPIEALSTAAIAAHDTETRFHTMAAGADRGRALAILDRLDAGDRAGAS
jgi:hypothetical protein